MKFIAEIIEIKSRKTVSLDKEYTIKLRCTDHGILSLAALPSDENVLVEIRGEHDSRQTDSK